MIRIPILSLLIAFSAFANSPEYLVGGTVPAAAARDRYSPSVASNGEDFFAVWTDRRAGEGAVIGTRVTRDGRVLDPLGVRIGTAKIGVHSPSVAWDGGAYLVAWTASADFGKHEIHAARVAADGSIVMQPRVISVRGWMESSHAVASNGTVSVIVYMLAPGSGAVTAAVLDRDGNKLDENTLSVSGLVNSPAVAAASSRFVVAWTQWSGNGSGPAGVAAIPLAATGLAAGTPATLVHGGQFPHVGSDGTRFTVAWLDHDGQDDILASRTFDENLAPVGDEHFLFGEEVHPAGVLWTGDRYEVVALKNRAPHQYEIVSAALDRDGDPLGQPRSRGDVSSEVLMQDLVAGTNGTDLLAVRMVQGPPDDFSYTMFSHLYRGNGTAADAPVLLSWSGNAHSEPSIASSTSGVLAAWVEHDGVFATRLDRNGHSLDGRGIRLTGFRDSVVRAAFDGMNYVVAWRDRSDSFEVVVRWIAPLTGATVAERRLGAWEFPGLALAASPAATYVVLTERGSVRVARIPHATYTPDSVSLDVSPPFMNADHPAAAWNGTELLVAWSELHGSPRVSPPLYVPFQVRAARVSASLTLLDPEPLFVIPAPDAFRERGLPSVASDGTDWLVVADSPDGEIFARRVLGNGTLEGAGPMQIGEGFHPAVAWSGSRYAVAWKDDGLFDFERSLVLAAVPRAGTPVASARSIVSNRTAESRPAIAGIAGNEAAVVYTKFSHRPEHAGAERSFLRVMDFGTRGRVVRR